MSSTTCPKMTFFCGACRPVSAAHGEEVHLCPSSVRRGRCPHRPAGGRWRPPLRCGTFPFSGPPPKPSGGSGLCRWRRGEGSGACGDAVTLRALRDGQLLTAPPKMPLACGQPVFRSTQFSVALLPGLRASYYISFAELIFTPGPMVEAHTQERMY